MNIRARLFGVRSSIDKAYEEVDRTIDFLRFNGFDTKEKLTAIKQLEELRHNLSLANLVASQIKEDEL